MDTTLLHPMIIHFPISLLIVGFVAELAGTLFKRPFYSRAGLYLLLVGAAGVVAAYISGNSAGSGVTEAGALKQTLERHEAAATMTLVITATAALARIALVLLKDRGTRFTWVALILFAASVASIARTGFYGGELVFKHAAGVQFSLGLDAAGTSPDDPKPESQ